MNMDRGPTIKLMQSHGANLIPMYGDRRYHRGYKKRSSESRISLHNSNLGMHLGRKSSGLVAVIIDHYTSPKAADFFLPPTGIVFGRPSRPRSHRIYRCTSECCYSHRLKHDNMQSVELRGDWNYMTLIPSSQHVSGEIFEFCSTDAPTCISYEELYTSIRMLNGVSIATRRYRKVPTDYLKTLVSLGFKNGLTFPEIDHYIAQWERYCTDGDPYWNMKPKQLNHRETTTCPDYNHLEFCGEQDK